jgi:hypothetical protein
MYITTPPSITVRRRLRRRERAGRRLGDSLSAEARHTFDLVCLHAGIAELFGYAPAELALGVRQAYERLRVEDARGRAPGAPREQ